MIYRSVVGFHLCLHIQGCFATCGTITETPSIVVCSSPGRADHTYLDTVAQTACCQMVHFLFFSTDWSQVIVYMTTRLGAVAFTVLWCKWSTYMLCTPRTVMQGWGQYQCDSIQVTIHGATSRCQGACHQCLPNTLASDIFWSPPIGCTIEVAALLVVTEEAAILDVAGRLSHTCTCQRRGKRWDHSQGAGVSQQWYKGSYPMHNPALLAKRFVLVKRSDVGLLPRMGNSTQTWKGCNLPP